MAMHIEYFFTDTNKNMFRASSLLDNKVFHLHSLVTSFQKKKMREFRHDLSAFTFINSFCMQATSSTLLAT